MTLQHPSIPDVGLRDAGFALSWLVAIVLLVPVQLASMILFDATGLDGVAPDLVFMVAVPALVLASIPAGVAHRLYSRRATGVTVAVGVVAFALVAAYTMRFYGLCGAGC